MKASIPNTRPKVTYQPALGMIRPVTRTPRVYVESPSRATGASGRWRFHEQHAPAGYQISGRALVIAIEPSPEMMHAS